MYIRIQSNFGANLISTQNYRFMPSGVSREYLVIHHSLNLRSISSVMLRLLLYPALHVFLHGSALKYFNQVVVRLGYGAQYLSGRTPDSQSSEPGFESPFGTVSKIGHFRSLH